MNDKPRRYIVERLNETRVFFDWLQLFYWCINNCHYHTGWIQLNGRYQAVFSKLKQPYNVGGDIIYEENL